jgi:hypothetical protein
MFNNTVSTKICLASSETKWLHTRIIEKKIQCCLSPCILLDKFGNEPLVPNDVYVASQSAGFNSPTTLHASPSYRYSFSVCWVFLLLSLLSLVNVCVKIKSCNFYPGVWFRRQNLKPTDLLYWNTTADFIWSLPQSVIYILFSPGATTPIGGCILQPSSGL